MLTTSQHDFNEDDKGRIFLLKSLRPCLKIRDWWWNAGSCNGVFSMKERRRGRRGGCGHREEGGKATAANLDEGDIAATVDLNEGGDEWRRTNLDGGRDTGLDLDEVGDAVARGSRQRGIRGSGGEFGRGDATLTANLDAGMRRWKVGGGRKENGHGRWRRKKEKKELILRN
ncbi:hypothetical protein S83_062071 [Arachis hypogaea]